MGALAESHSSLFGLGRECAKQQQKIHEVAGFLCRNLAYPCVVDRSEPYVHGYYIYGIRAPGRRASTYVQ